MSTAGVHHAARAVLAQAAGTYSERPPRRDLRDHFACTWFHRLPAAQPVVVVPDGAVDLLWVGGDLRVAGPDRQAAVEHLPPGETVVGLRFVPGAAKAWLGVPLSELAGSRVPLAQFWDVEARRLADWLSEAADPTSVAERLEAALARTAAVTRVDDDAARLFRIVRECVGTETAVIEELTQRLGLSERTLRRRSSDAFGYGPKTLERVLRLHHFFAALRTPRPLPLADLAAESGYADQAHLSRELRALTGFTPKEILDQMRRSAGSFKTRR